MEDYICPDCGSIISYKTMQAKRQKRCICGTWIEKSVLQEAGIAEQELHFRCAYCGTDNAINPERTPSSYTVTCQACSRKVAEVRKYAPIVYGRRDYA